jgi:hypothetical protein
VKLSVLVLSIAFLIAPASQAKAAPEIKYYEGTSKGVDKNNKPVVEFKTYLQVSNDFEKGRLQSKGLLFDETKGGKFVRVIDQLDVKTNGKWTNYYMDGGKWKTTLPDIKIDGKHVASYKVTRQLSDGITWELSTKKEGSGFYTETVFLKGKTVDLKLTGKMNPSTKAAYEAAAKKIKK